MKKYINIKALVQYLEDKDCEDNFKNTVQYLEDKGWESQDINTFLLSLIKEYNINCDCELFHNLLPNLEQSKETLSVKQVQKMLNNNIPVINPPFQIIPDEGPQVFIKNTLNNKIISVPLFAAREVIEALNNLFPPNTEVSRD